MEQAIQQLRQFCREHPGFRLEVSEGPSDLPGDLWRVAVELWDGVCRFRAVFYLGSEDPREADFRYRAAAAELIRCASQNLALRAAGQSPPIA